VLLSAPHYAFGRFRLASPSPTTRANVPPSRWATKLRHRRATALFALLFLPAFLARKANASRKKRSKAH